MNELINFNDIIKNSVIQSSFLGNFTIQDILSVIVVTLVVSLFMFFIYKKTYSGNIYSHKFNVSLVLMALITSEIIMTISSNLVLSLGMVGALSIVRFRTAVKEPLDIVFMFWAIAIGITAGARLYALCVISSLLIGLVLFTLLKFKNTNNVFLLVIHYDSTINDKIFALLSELSYTVKSKTISRGLVELTIELKIIGARTGFVEDLSEVEGVASVSLINYNGEFAQ
ncbi:MAG: DUF4956 domain-containing protein [Sphaerochaetaceae bacterium]|nr:DUF4956 domain-containing protein [Sphaerochaetaceae bacterium]MDC7238407.1 DUF4956 domain-containing protein [Sphaerochaetaceae bacterium]MDC7248716.1 DUF4956 domain-containing protein [Sphaerochaetaceae bacterium]